MFAKDGRLEGVDPFKSDARVFAFLPNQNFQIEIGGKAHEVLAHVSGKMRMHFIKILPGDVVTLEISPYDLSRGRITYRQK